MTPTTSETAQVRSAAIDARQVVANPERYAARPLLRRLAWITLMTQRGFCVDQARLAAMPVETAND